MSARIDQTGIDALLMLARQTIDTSRFIEKIAPASAAHEVSKTLVHELHTLAEEWARIIARAEFIAELGSGESP
jgi:hypothetical protein